MDLTIAALLAQDGITNGAVYALLALALVMVFAVTRVIWVPAGEFVSYGTLTLAALQLGKAPGTVELLAGMALIAGAMEAWSCLAQGHARRLPRRLLLWTVVPLAIAALTRALAPLQPPFIVQIALTLAAVTALGPLLYRIVYQPLAEASVLVLLIVSVAVHFALTGLGLWFFGAEGSRTPPFSGESFRVGDMIVSAQSLLVVLTSLLLILGLYLFFGRTLYGKALRATAVNRVGARLVGISPRLAGSLTFTLATLAVRLLGRADRTDHDDLLRFRLSRLAQGLRRRHHRRTGELSACGGRIAPGRSAGIVFLVLGERLQGSDRIHPDHPGAAVALADGASSRR